MRERSEQVDLTCIHCGRPAKLVAFHVEPSRDEGHAAAPYRDPITKPPLTEDHPKAERMRERVAA